MNGTGDAVVVRDLVKHYPKRPRPAVDGLSFSVRRGEIFGLLGPNGAGKTTTIGVLTTRIIPTSGTALVAGIDVVADAPLARSALAVVTQHNNLDRPLSIRQNLLMHGIYHGIPRARRRRRADELLDEMGLGDVAGVKADNLSGGQQQRVKIARSLMHEPSVLFVDEPSTGLDPQSRLFVYDKLAELNAKGVTVVLTTHDMEEASRLCHRVGIVDHGNLIALDDPAALTNSLPGNVAINLAVDTRGQQPDLLVKVLGEVPGVDWIERIDDAASPELGEPYEFRLHSTTDSTKVLADALRVLHETGSEVSDVGISKPNLEDVFIELTGKGLR